MPHFIPSINNIGTTANSSQTHIYDIINSITKFKERYIQKQGVKTGIKTAPSSSRLSSWIYNNTKATASISVYPGCSTITCPSGYSPTSYPVNCSFLPCQYVCINSNGLYWNTPCSNNV